MAVSGSEDECGKRPVRDGASSNGSINGQAVASCGDSSRLERINQFSLVGYVPGKLGDFLTELRKELVGGCIARSHVTILPPRPLQADIAEAGDELRHHVAVFPPFHISIPRIRVFQETSVIFADLGAGRDRVLEMHDVLNAGVFFQHEQYNFHPHITLAQGIPPGQVNEVYEIALRRWSEAPAAAFDVETLTFVQNTSNNQWIDLLPCELRGALQAR